MHLYIFIFHKIIADKSCLQSFYNTSEPICEKATDRNFSEVSFQVISYSTFTSEPTCEKPHQNSAFQAALGI